MSSDTIPTRTRLPVLLILVALLGACTSIERRPVPEELAHDARLPGFGSVRCFEKEFDPVLGPSLAASFAEERSEDYGRDGAGRTIYPILALSSGGSDGAFGAGLLHGWSEAGDRPIFKIVTGVSTGALIAPLAFLGRAYDPLLKELYTELTRDDIAESKNPLAFFYSDSLASNEPLVQLVRKHVDESMLARVAEEHRAGRRLYIGTTNLDLQRLVIWDMGAIATSGQDGALRLFQEVMLASSAIPVVFPPIYFEVEAGGEFYDEIHVDGSVRSLMFLPQVITRRLGDLGESGSWTRLFIVRNGQLSWTFEAVEPTVTAIAGRTILTLLQSMAKEELESLFLVARADGVDFNVTAIPPDYVRENKEEFDRDEMRRLFAVGRRLALEGGAWMKAPPGFTLD